MATEKLQLYLALQSVILNIFMCAVESMANHQSIRLLEIIKFMGAIALENFGELLYSNLV